MPTLRITIPIVSEWPTSKELARRDKVEAALEASEIGQCTGAGSGLGVMNLTYRVDNDSRVPAARARIDAAMARHMPGFEYEVAMQSEPARKVPSQGRRCLCNPACREAKCPRVCRFVFQRYKGFTACPDFRRVSARTQTCRPRCPNVWRSIRFLCGITPLPTELGRSLEAHKWIQGP